MTPLFVLATFVTVACATPRVPFSNNCPAPINCDNVLNPGDCQRIERGFFEMDGHDCPACRICIREADKHFRLVKWMSRKPIPERYMKPSCLPQGAEFKCQETPYYGMVSGEEGLLYFDVASGCLIDAYPGTGGVFDPAVCKKLHLHAQYFYDGSGKKCYVFDSMYC